MSDDRRPADSAAAHPALLEMLEGLLADVPDEPSSAVPYAEPAVDPRPTLLPDVLPIPLDIPASTSPAQERECIFYGLGDTTLDTPESRFTAIKFSVGRFEFVAPLNMLDGVSRVDDSVTPMVGQAAWHRGVTVNRGHQLTLVDLGVLLGLADTEPVTDLDHVVLLPDGRHGLVSSTAPQPLELAGNDIRWARATRSRPWLAALLPAQMCVLVDVEVFLDMLYARNPRT